MSTTRVTEALLYTELSPAKNLVSSSAAAKLTSFHRRPPIAKQASNLLKYFLTRDGVHAFNYLQFLFEQCPAFLANNVDCAQRPTIEWSNRPTFMEIYGTVFRKLLTVSLMPLLVQSLRIRCMGHGIIPREVTTQAPVNSLHTYFRIS